MSEKYQQYKKEDFLNDESFIRYIRGGSPDAAWWEAYQHAAPENLRELQDAAAALRLIFTAKRIFPAPQLADEVWHSIAKGMDADSRKPLLRQIRRRWIGVAAAVLLLITGSVAWYMFARTTIHTAYGKMSAIVLPDSSTIILNSNSVVSYKKYWGSGRKREVWLEGEAFFEVRHLKKDRGPVLPAEQFIVHTQQVDVAVLGTTFNVKERHGITEVGLRTGAVQITAHEQQLRLQPGEVAQFNRQSGLMKLSPKAVQAVSAWKNHTLIMDEMQVSEILQLLEDNYGYHAVITDTTILNKRFKGIFPVKNEDDIIFVLAGLLQMDIEKKDHQLIFKQRF
ncbi:FecR family protein [Chitinophaga sp. Cy-1792]|uniref:FecR family protein n=1 Tax=Chitinophaga sp. Cy-1792 TaxID=2608339 RepID=UPI001423B888|nr:FecR domain-containing protein [Chitinophaga sp. Cy-1792]NIG54459.1 DUF4974 domain-containing protein [Chitinophaga sp. Cy-1792]